MDCADVVWSVDRRSSRPCFQGPIPAGSLVYAKRDHVGAIFQHLRRSRSRAVVVTSESDDPILNGSRNQAPPQVVSWFSTNSFDPGVDSIPLGLGNSYCGLTAKAADLARVAGLHLPRDKWLLVNFRPRTNPSVRGPLLQHYRASGWATVEEGLDPEACLQAMASHRFVLCPAGNGVDTHRLWEALYLGAIPIVEKHPALQAFADLPILQVDDLAALDGPRLEKEYGDFLSRPRNLAKLFFPHWEGVLKDALARLRQEPAKLSFSRFLSGWISLRKR